MTPFNLSQPFYVFVISMKIFGDDEVRFIVICHIIFYTLMIRHYT